MQFEETIQLLQNLRGIGLSASEANVYLVLLTLGTNPVSTVAKKADLNRSSCYDVLKRLMKKGFVTQIRKRNISYFAAVEPKIMLHQLNNKKDNLEQKIENLGRSLKELETIQCEHAQKPSVVFFEGKAGILNIMEDTLTSSEPLRAYASLKELTEILPNYFPKYYKRRTKKGIFVKAIYPTSKETYRHKLRDTEEHRESRLIPPEFDFHLDILIYDNKVAITSLKEKFGLLIKSESLAKAQKKIFDIIWAGTKQYDEVMTNMMEKKCALA